MARPPLNATPGREGPRVNDEIRVPQVRVIDADGEMVGIMQTRDALARAFAAGLDLLEISPTAEPPVAKILDYGKFKYEQQKKRNEARKKQKVIEIKEVKIRPGTGEHDYQTKRKAVLSFLEGGDKVKVSLRFKGREMAHQDLGFKMLERLRVDVEELAKPEQMPRLENRQMVMILAPR
ncbi:translation initiation factor IF-3 [Aristophania vespae]|uniref:Translation initiation factor IF-3 n=1 Tax=Aristophania vespae TaxID=2697033 RepID=A0A6P1NDE4_9PROT|nr:translation initiation factor IF-3 [Aristophania vespae]QHI96326.1 translation initiation factor IF-3 [Aristophania vespae]